MENQQPAIQQPAGFAAQAPAVSAATAVLACPHQDCPYTATGRGRNSRLYDHLFERHAAADTDNRSRTVKLVKRKTVALLFEEIRRDSATYNLLIQRIIAADQRFQKYRDMSIRVEPHNLDTNLVWPIEEADIYQQAGGRSREALAGLLVRMRETMLTGAGELQYPKGSALVMLDGKLRYVGGTAAYAEVADDLEQIFQEWESEAI